ncbi:MAG: polysaccharide lyase 8 family protein [Treponema sp.]|jgi:chondroitin AC lyase|nr:polysaccharide lyase 8 family protein [Treponema sp.]
MINPTKKLFVIGLMCLSVLSYAEGKRQMPSVQSRNDEVFDLIISRIQQENEKLIPANLDAAVSNALNLWTEAGAFSDVNYADISRTNWAPQVHVDRLYQFALAYTAPSSSYYGNEDLYHKIAAGLQYWYDQNPNCDNWWYNQIGEPQKVGVTLIQMRKGTRRLPAELERNTLERMKAEGGNPAEWTGANKTDIALHWLYRACLSRDAGLLKTTLDQAYEPIVLVSEAEGIQHDYSYFQHGPQLYTVGYGSELIKGVTFFAMFTAGTPYALSGEKLDILSAFIRETFLPAYRGRYSLFSIGGRGVLSRARATSGGAPLIYTERMKQIDPAYSGFYDDAVKRLRGDENAGYGITANHTHYPIADYTLHTRPEYVFDVRLVSTRTLRLEHGNGENLKTYYVSDGCTNIAVRGGEYADIFPVWNWTRVPGITCPQTETIPLPPREWGVQGTSVFAGGVSDGRYGVTAYSYNADYTGNSAKKGWFFFDDEVVCLGSGITANESAAEYEINTTLNQCLLNGPVTASVQNTISVLSQGDHSFADAPDWALHDGVGYFFPQGGVIGLSAKPQSGNWRDINTSQPDGIITKDVFTLWFNHGKNTVSGSYVYTVVPGKTTADEMEAYLQQNEVEIYANTDSIQAVYHKGLDILGLVFYEAGTFEHDGMTIQVDKPCTILFRDAKKTKPAMYIADPSQSQSQITVVTALIGVSAVKTMVCDFTNTAVFAGATKVYTIE